MRLAPLLLIAASAGAILLTQHLASGNFLQYDGRLIPSLPVPRPG